MPEFKKIGNIYDEAGQQEELSGLERMRRMLVGGFKGVGYGAELAARAGVENWMNPDTNTLSGMTGEEVVALYDGHPEMQAKAQVMVDRMAAERRAAGQELVRVADRQAADMKNYAVEDPNFVEKLAGGAGSMAALAPVGVAAALSRNPQLAVALPVLLEAASESGGAQRELINKYGFNPVDAAQATKPLMAANAAIGLVAPGVARAGAGLAGRAAGNPMAKLASGFIRNAAEEGAQEMGQNIASGLQVAQAAGVPVSETIDPIETLEEGAVGAALGVLGESVNTGFDMVTKTPEAPAAEIVEGNGISEGAAKYLETGDINEWINQTTRDATPGDNKVAPSFAELDEQTVNAIVDQVANVPGKMYEVTGRKYLFGAIAQGEVGSLIEQHLLQPQMEAELARRKFMDTYAERFSSVLKGLNGKQLADLRQRLESEEHAQDQDVLEVRAILDELHEHQNTARIKRGDKELGYIKNYLHHMQSVSLVDRMLARGELKNTGKRGAPRAKYTPSHARNRKGSDTKFEENLPVLLDAYVRNAAKDIFNNPVLAQNTQIADALEERGLKGAANNIREYSARIWADEAHGLTEYITGLGRPARAVAEVAKFQRRRLTDAALVGNLAWALTIQPSSIALTFSRHGVRNSMRAFTAAFDPAFRRYVFNELRGGVEKGGGEGALFQDVGSDSSITGSKRVKSPTALERVRHILNLVSHEIEKTLYAHGAAAAYYDGKQRGFTGNTLRQWMNNGGSKTQSDYYRADQPGWMHAKEASSFAPFMSFINEMANAGVETVLSPAIHAATGKRVGVGHYRAYQGKSRAKSAALATKRFATLFAAMLMWEELWAYPMGGRRPFRDLFFGRPDRFSPMPLDLVYDALKSLSDVAKYGDIDPLIKFANRYYTVGGAGLERLRSTLKAVLNDGNVTQRQKRDGVVREYNRYNISGNEIQSAIFGPGATPEGKESNNFPDAPGWSLVVQLLEKVQEPDGGGPVRASRAKRPRPKRPHPSRPRR